MGQRSTPIETKIKIDMPDADGFKNKIKPYLLDALAFGYLICVIYFFATDATEDQLVDLPRNAKIAGLSLLVGLVVTVMFDILKIKTLGAAVFTPLHLKGKEKVKSWFKTFWGAQLMVTFMVTIIVGGIVTDFSIWELLDEDGLAGARRIVTALTNPNWEVLPVAVNSIIETIYIAFMATVIAIPFAFVLSFFAAKNIMGKHPVTFAIYTFLRGSFNIARSIEPLIWAIIFSVWVGIGSFAGMLALMIHSIASLTKQYSEIIEVVNDGPIEGIQSTGANMVQVIWFAVVPQVVLPMISFTIYRWDINVRMATIIGLVGGGGIGNLLNLYLGQAMWNEIATLAVVIVAVVWAMDTASAYIREALK